jgi:hypothetical protein
LEEISRCTLSDRTEEIFTSAKKQSPQDGRIEKENDVSFSTLLNVTRHLENRQVERN